VLSIDARVWVTWLVVTAALTMVARNPLYSLTLLLAVRLVAGVSESHSSEPGIPVRRFGIAILVFVTLFNGLSIHIGDTVLFRLPASWPWIGGPITVEAAVHGMGAGLVLFTLLILFATFNAIVPTSEFVRMTPRALRDIGVVVLIAVTYVPETKRQLSRIREAQAIRGHRLRSASDWRPILIPLLIGGLERAMALAEAMVSRGFGATADVRQPLSVQIGLVAGLLSALTGWVLTFWNAWVGWLLLGVGLLLIVAIVLRIGRRTPYTRYRPRSWTAKDTLMLAAAVLPLLLVFVPLPFVDRTTLLFVPFPSLRVPGFDPVIGLGLASVAMPATLLYMKQKIRHDSD
jgi:energy-coupling factor transport system permease protein